jgi:hypothetical protein
MEDQYFPQNDLQVALMFFPEIDGGIVVVVDEAKNIPYVKRAVLQQLGAPSKDLGWEIWYSGKFIRFVPMRLVQRMESQYGDGLEGYRDEQVFYVQSW